MIISTARVGKKTDRNFVQKRLLCLSRPVCPKIIRHPKNDFILPRQKIFSRQQRLIRPPILIRRRLFHQLAPLQTDAPKLQVNPNRRPAPNRIKNMCG